MARPKLPPELKVSQAESSKRYRQQKSKTYQLYEKRRCEERKLNRISKGKQVVIKLRFNKRGNSKKVFPRRSATTKPLEKPGGKKLAGATKAKGVMAETEPEEQILQKDNQDNRTTMPSVEMLPSEGSSGEMQSAEGPSGKRPSRGRKSAESNFGETSFRGRPSSERSQIEENSRKRKVTWSVENGPPMETSDSETDDPLWQNQSPPKKAKRAGDTTTKSRQSIAGEKARKKNLASIKNDLKMVQDENVELRKELTKKSGDLEEETIMRQRLEAEVKVKDAQNEELKSKRIKDNTWLKFVYKDLSSEAAREFKLAVFNNRENFEPGIMSRLREASGINFSKAPLPKAFNQTEREKAIQDFAILNSSEIPDMKANKSESSTNKTPNKRFAIHYLNVLHDQFNIDNPELKCCYSTFTLLWPNYVIKPRPGDFTSCHCTTCENNSLFISALIKNRILEESEDVFSAIKVARDGNSEALDHIAKKLKDAENGARKNEIITYVQWENVTKEISEARANFAKENGKKRVARTESKKRMKSIKIKDLMSICQDSFDKLKDHLDRNIVMKTTIAAKKEEVLNDATMKSALVWIDWSEGVELRQEREIQSAWFGASTLSLQSGYIFRKNRSRGFGSFAEGTDHKAEAIWASLRPLLLELLEEGVDKVYFVSDSPVNQYRCNKNIFFLSEWCASNGISAVWFFTETSHGKSSADGIGGSLKTTIRELMRFHTGTPVNSISDLMNLLQGNTNNRVLYFTKEDVEREKASLPTNLKSLKGALQIHEIKVSVSGEIGAKKLPTDTSYSRVSLAPSFFGTSNNIPSSRLRTPLVEIHPSVTEE